MSEQPQSRSGLSQISTRWSTINDPVQFMMRYAAAVHSYLDAVLREAHDAEDAFQKFCLRVVEKGFAGASAERGRFRDYLKKSVRNFALNYRRDHRRPASDADLEQLPEPSPSSPDAEHLWLAEWQRTLLGRAWHALETHQEQAGNLAYTALRLTADHPDETSDQLALRIAQTIGKPFRADAFRKQVSRARHLFAQLLRYEVSQTIEDATPQMVEEELIETGLMPYLRGLLEE